MSNSCDPQKDDKDTSSFPYERLPNEMKVPILKNIHDPQDKLNIVEALPCSEWLMGWDYAYLQFESIYPLVYPYLKWPYEDESYDWKNVLNLSKASPEFQRIVTSHFEKYITLTHDRNSGNQLFRENQQQQIWTFYEPLLSIHAAALDEKSLSWHTALPFGISTYLSTKSQIPFLKKLGKKVWCLELSLINAYHIPGIVGYLFECLQLVPNLRRLNLVDIFPHEFATYLELRPPVVLHEEKVMLPELPRLKMISLIGDCSSCQQWILPKYTRQLEVLNFHDCFLTENFNPTCFPKLNTMNIKFTQRDEYHNASIDRVNDLLKKFLLSPLKALRVILDEVTVAKFFNFMLTLNNFGSTLEALEMKVGRMNAEMDDGVKNEVESWVSQLNFPKLRCLHLENYVGPLEFLLKMSSLRKLSIINSSKMPLQRSNVKELQFSVKKNGTLETSIWKKFPLLEWFEMGAGEWEWFFHKRGIKSGLPLEYWEPY